MAVDAAELAGGPGTRAAGAQLHALFDEHARMVYGLCRALIRDAHDAEDATQATFVSAYRALLGGTEPREPGAWLATIARNECAGRAQARMREPLPLPETDDWHGDGGGLEAELDRKAAIVELRAAIAELPASQREAIVLREIYGLHYAEVGAALGMSVASVEALLFRARRTLRVSLKPLAGGALSVPLAVREGVAQAIPAFGDTGAAAAGGAAGLGLLAKLASGPVGAKVAAGVAAAVAAGSVAATKVERGHDVGPRAVPVVSSPAPLGESAAHRAPVRTPHAASTARTHAVSVVGVGATKPLSGRTPFVDASTPSDETEDDAERESSTPSAAPSAERPSSASASGEHGSAPGKDGSGDGRDHPVVTSHEDAGGSREGEERSGQEAGGGSSDEGSNGSGDSGDSSGSGGSGSDGGKSGEGSSDGGAVTVSDSPA